MFLAYTERLQSNNSVPLNYGTRPTPWDQTGARLDNFPNPR
jgi:hypothetical protein